MVGAMLVAGAAMCAGGGSRAAPTIGGFLDAAGFALAADGDGGFSLAPTAGGWLATEAPAIRTAGVDDDGFAGGPSADGIEASSTERATAAPPLISCPVQAATAWLPGRWRIGLGSIPRECRRRWRIFRPGQAACS